MSIAPVIGARRRKLLAHLETIHARGSQNAKTLDEIAVGWDFGLIKGLRMRGLKIDTRFLVARNKLGMTADRKYYLL